MKAFIRVLQDTALMLTRIVMGVVMVAHGWHRWQGTGVNAQVAILRAVGVPSPELMAWAVIGFEIVGGVLLIFGLGTPLIGFGLIVLNCGVIFMHRAGVFYAHNSGWEYNAVMAAVGAILLAHGSGRAGLDSLFIQPRDEDDEYC